MEKSDEDRDTDSGEVDLLKEIGLRMEGVREIQKMPKNIPEWAFAFKVGATMNQLGDVKYMKDMLAWAVVECMMLQESISPAGRQAVLSILKYLAEHESLHEDNIAYMIIRFRDMPMPEESDGEAEDEPDDKPEGDPDD